MQCYPGKVMRLYLSDVGKKAGVKIRLDDLVLDDLPHQANVSDWHALMALDESATRDLFYDGVAHSKVA